MSCVVNIINIISNFYPRSPCGERRRRVHRLPPYQGGISIHALRVESDQYLPHWQGRQAENFYPRSPCGERLYTVLCTFTMLCNFYPRSPCGERPQSPFGKGTCENFYPRSPCGERLGDRFDVVAIAQFLSTLSVWRATTSSASTAALSRRDFYPRSPCGERPSSSWTRPTRWQHFYPRSPCGERRHPGGSGSAGARFLSTLSVWRATSISLTGKGGRPRISIHALRVESDGFVWLHLLKDFFEFLSKLSVWRATAGAAAPGPKSV